MSASRISARNNRGWIIVSGLILVAVAVLSYLTPAVGGLIGGCLWAILVIVPNIGTRKVDRLVAQQRFGQASRVAKFISWLHPVDGWREQPELLHALELGQRGAMAEAIVILDRYQTATTPTGRCATVSLYQMDARWEELLVWIQDNLSETVLQKDFDMLVCYLRALGETGDLNGMLQAWERYELSLEKIPKLRTRNLARMFVLAFSGQTEQVARLFTGPLANYSNTIKLFWLATVDQAAGKDSIAHEQFLSISNTSDIRLRNEVARRLSNPVVVAESILTEKSQQILDKISTEIEDEARYSGGVSLKPRQAIATYFIISLNVLAFVLEVKLGGSTNVNNLYRLGALVPEEVVTGSWWRVLTAAFLHFGFLHLLMNMLGLYLFGRLVEFALGIPRFLLLYFTSAIGSMLVVTYMAVMGYSQADFVVGASGCVMGLVGAFAAVLLQDWQRKKTRLAARSLRGIVILILLQVIFDLTTPQVSFVGHTSGVMIGFVVGMILRQNWLGER
ncbi:rhomboid family intramembrane serine protease [Mastigocladopsis repens]|uniref:rhomboid family intramembrane serine protease n=1 Tax=Mastigocladopsis repens TaxID=221287 RepID=UPI000380F52C|nr:rhomboid family intramembrane serine protease [Mastigocladopsis repens]